MPEKWCVVRRKNTQQIKFGMILAYGVLNIISNICIEIMKEKEKVGLTPKSGVEIILKYKC